MAALRFLDTLRHTHPQLSEWHDSLSDLCQRKLWHQLTLKLEQFVTLPVFQAGDALIQFYHNVITDFEAKINPLKLAHFAVIVSRKYAEKEGAICYLEGVIEKLRDSKELCLEEPILYKKTAINFLTMENLYLTAGPTLIHLCMQVTTGYLLSTINLARNLPTSTKVLFCIWRYQWTLYRNHLSWIWHLIYPLLHYWEKISTTSGNCSHIPFRPSEDRTIPLTIIAERTRLSIEDVEYLLMKSLSVHLIEGIIDQVEGTVHVSWVQPRVLGIPQLRSLCDKLDNWMEKVHGALLSVESETPDLVAS